MLYILIRNTPYLLHGAEFKKLTGMQVKMEVPSWPAYRTTTNTEWLYQKLYSCNCPPEDEHRVARNM